MLPQGINQRWRSRGLNPLLKTGNAPVSQPPVSSLPRATTTTSLPSGVGTAQPRPSRAGLSPCLLPSRRTGRCPPSHRITGEGASEDHLVQPPCRSRVTWSRLHRAASRGGFEHLQRRRLYSPSGEPVPALRQSLTGPRIS